MTDAANTPRTAALLAALDMLHHYAFKGRHTASEARAIDGARAAIRVIISAWLNAIQCPHCWHVHMDYNDEPCVSCGCEYALRDMAEAAAPTPARIGIQWGPSPDHLHYLSHVAEWGPGDQDYGDGCKATLTVEQEREGQQTVRVIVRGMAAAPTPAEPLDVLAQIESLPWPELIALRGVIEDRIARLMRERQP
jgi:hypothetical protein